MKTKEINTPLRLKEWFIMFPIRELKMFGGKRMISSIEMPFPDSSVWNEQEIETSH